MPRNKQPPAKVVDAGAAAPAAEGEATTQPRGAPGAGEEFKKIRLIGQIRRIFLCDWVLPVLAKMLAGRQYARVMRRVETVRTRFQSLEIWKSPHATEFRVEGAVHAWHHRSRYLTGLAWDLIAAGALLHPGGPPRSVLMLGLAGGTSFRIVRHLLPECRLTAVDIDSGIVELARRHMDLDALGAEVILGDAYPWLAENRRVFDVVIDDVYLAGKTDVFRPRAWDAGLLGHLRRAVAPGGLLAVNLVTGSGHRSMQSLTRGIMRQHFGVVRSVRSPMAMNEVLVAGAEVATGRGLADFRDAFDDWRDRDLWDCLAVRSIG